MNLLFIYPMFTLVMLTAVMAFVLFFSRLNGARKGAIKMRHFQTMSGHGEPTELMTKASRHFTNLFEMPVLFYAGSITAMVIPLSGTLILFWAWLFVFAR